MWLILFIYFRHKLSKDGDAFLGLVHRIDRTASGVIVFSKTTKSAARLSEMFKKREISKYYLCVVNGHVVNDNGVLHDLLVQANSKKTSVFPLTSNRKDGVTGILRYSVIKRIIPNTKPINNSTNSTTTAAASNHIKPLNEVIKNKQTILAIELETGRKHQIRYGLGRRMCVCVYTVYKLFYRAQLAHLGHPIVGDVKYGAPQRFKHRDIPLHSAILSFPHPVSKSKVMINSSIIIMVVICI